jgi:hypothetical protein
LDLSTEEAQYLVDILDFWIDGYEEATTNSLVETPASSVEELLSFVSGMHSRHGMAITIREKLYAYVKGETWRPMPTVC